MITDTNKLMSYIVNMWNYHNHGNSECSTHALQVPWQTVDFFLAQWIKIDCSGLFPKFLFIFSLIFSILLFIMQDLHYYFHFGKSLCNSSNISGSHCGSLSFGLGYYFLGCCCCERVLETQGTPLKKLLLYKRPKQEGHGKWIIFPLGNAAYVKLSNPTEVFLMSRSLKRAFLEMPALRGHGMVQHSCRLSPQFLSHAQQPQLSERNNVIVWFCAGPWSESGEELLNETGQLPVKIHFTLSQSSDRFWSDNSWAKRGNVHSHSHLWLFILETLKFLRVTLTKKAILVK